MSNNSLINRKFGVMESMNSVYNADDTEWMSIIMWHEVWHIWRAMTILKRKDSNYCEGYLNSCYCKFLLHYTTLIMIGDFPLYSDMHLFHTITWTGGNPYKELITVSWKKISAFQTQERPAVHNIDNYFVSCHVRAIVWHFDKITTIDGGNINQTTFMMNEPNR